MDRNALKQNLLELLENETWDKADDVTEDTDLREGLNLDSVDMVSLVLEIQNQFKIEIGSKELDGVKCVGDLLDLLERKTGISSHSKAA